MVDFNKIPLIVHEIVADADLELILRLEQMTIEELVTYAENEQDLSEDDAEMIQGFIAAKLEKRCPNVFGVNAMKKFFAEAETAEERRAHAERLVANAQAAYERGEH